MQAFVSFLHSTASLFLLSVEMFGNLFITGLLRSLCSSVGSSHKEAP
jgi:hypothetical protein